MVYCSAPDLIDVYYEKVYNTNNSEILAEDFDTHIQIRMYDESGFPKIIVMGDGAILDTVDIMEFDEFEDQVNELYKEYIYTTGETASEIEEAAIADRQLELENAAVDFLAAVLETSVVYAEKRASCFLPEFVDHVLEYLYKEHAIDPYRPMVLVDDSGKEFFEEYPYSCMEFD